MPGSPTGSSSAILFPVTLSKSQPLKTRAQEHILSTQIEQQVFEAGKETTKQANIKAKLLLVCLPTATWWWG